MTARETPERDIHSAAYRDAYSRINGMVVGAVECSRR
jgi:hypothetical protein